MRPPRTMRGHGRLASCVGCGCRDPGKRACRTRGSCRRKEARPRITRRNHYLRQYRYGAAGCRGGSRAIRKGREAGMRCSIKFCSLRNGEVTMRTIVPRNNSPATLTRFIAMASVAIPFLCCAILVTGQAASSGADAAASNWKQVEEAMGRPGQLQPGDVIKFGLPRKDLHVVLDSVEIKPGLALGSWVAFKRDGSGAMVMGDLVLTEDEVEPVMMKLQESGIHE